jgi:hypothetical protein
MTLPLPTTTDSPSTTTVRHASPTTRSRRAEPPCTNSYRDWRQLRRLLPSRRLPSLQFYRPPLLAPASSITLFRLNEKKRTTQMNIHSKQLKQIPKTNFHYVCLCQHSHELFRTSTPTVRYATLRAHQSDLCDQLCPRYLHFKTNQIAKRDCYRELTDEPLRKLPRLLSTVDRGVV